MRVVNVVVKFLALSKNGSLVISNGEVKIFGVDDATSALLQTEFQELQPSYNTTEASSSSLNSSIDSTILSTSYRETVELDEALAKITTYLNALDQQDFTIVSAFKDEFSALENKNGQYRIYIWTMQKM